VWDRRIARQRAKRGNGLGEPLSLSCSNRYGDLGGKGPNQHGPWSNSSYKLT